jgi:hypothetical protein
MIVGFRGLAKIRPTIIVAAVPIRLRAETLAGCGAAV